MNKARSKVLSLEEFKAEPMPAEWAVWTERTNPIFSEMKLFENCNSFIECHTRVREQTGVWIEELLPVFAKLDATLAKSRQG